MLLGNDGVKVKTYTIQGEAIAPVAQIGEGGGKLPQMGVEDFVDRWTADGKSLFVWNYAGIPRLDRVEIASGKRVPMYSIIAPDSSGIVNTSFCRTSQDGKAYVCSAHRLLSDLFVVKGLR